MKFQVKLEAEGLEKCTRGVTSTISPVLIFMLIGCRYIKIGEEWIGGMAGDSQGGMAALLHDLIVNYYYFHINEAIFLILSITLFFDDVSVYTFFKSTY